MCLLACLPVQGPVGREEMQFSHPAEYDNVCLFVCLDVEFWMMGLVLGNCIKWVKISTS